MIKTTQFSVLALAVVAILSGCSRLQQKDALANQQISVRRNVVKVNPGIMGTNWLHVRDGSGAEGSNDLTVATSSTSSALPDVGDTVLVTGTVTLDKDFGMGYRYPVILDNAEVTVE